MQRLLAAAAVNAMLAASGCGAPSRAAWPGATSPVAQEPADLAAEGLFPRPEEGLVRKALLKVLGNKSVPVIRLTRQGSGNWTFRATVRVTNIGAGAYTLQQPWSGSLSWATGVLTARYEVAAPGDRPGPGPSLHFAIKDL